MHQGTIFLAENDRLFLGEALFETIKVRQSIPLFSELHWKRLHRSAQLLGLESLPSFEEWQERLSDKIKQEKLIEGAVKLVFTGGTASRGLTEQGQDNQFLLHCFTYNALLNPVRLIKACWKRDASNPVYQLKTINYLEAIIARRHALGHKADDVLFFNTQDCVTEASCANIFLIQNNKIITPPQKDGVLPGITRFRLLKLCQHLTIEYAEQSINQKMIEQADAFFLCNALQGIYYASSYEKQSFSFNNPIVNRLKYLLEVEEKEYVKAVLGKEI